MDYVNHLVVLVLMEILVLFLVKIVFHNVKYALDFRSINVKVVSQILGKIIIYQMVHHV